MTANERDEAMVELFAEMFREQQVEQFPRTIEMPGSSITFPAPVINVRASEVPVTNVVNVAAPVVTVEPPAVSVAAPVVTVEPPAVSVAAPVVNFDAAAIVEAIDRMIEIIERLVESLSSAVWQRGPRTLEIRHPDGTYSQVIDKAQ